MDVMYVHLSRARHKSTATVDRTYKDANEGWITQGVRNLPLNELNNSIPQGATHV